MGAWRTSLVNTFRPLSSLVSTMSAVFAMLRTGSFLRSGNRHCGQRVRTGLRRCRHRPTCDDSNGGVPHPLMGQSRTDGARCGAALARHPAPLPTMVGRGAAGRSFSSLACQFRASGNPGPWGRAWGRSGPPMEPPLRRGTGDPRGTRRSPAGGPRSAGRAVLHYRIESRKAALWPGLARSSQGRSAAAPHGDVKRNVWESRYACRLCCGSTWRDRV